MILPRPPQSSNSLPDTLNDNIIPQTAPVMLANNGTIITITLIIITILAIITITTILSGPRNPGLSMYHYPRSN